MSDDHDLNHNFDDAEPVSKTARKREAERLQDIGRRLGQLSAEQLSGIDLPAELADAIDDYRRFPSHGAKRRQLQYIGKLMRDLDSDVIEAQLKDLDGESAQARYRFSQTERWREQLINDPDSLTQLIDAYPDVDRQRLRQLQSKARSANSEAQQKTHARALFRFLREIIEAS